MQSTVNQENPYMRIALLGRLAAQRSVNIFDSRRNAASFFYAAQGPTGFPKGFIKGPLNRVRAVKFDGRFA